MSWTPKYLVNSRSGHRVMLSGNRPSQARPKRAKVYGASTFSRNQLPGKVDLREFMTRVEDQAETNSCTANAIAGAYEYLLKRHAGEELDISRLFVYYNARELDGIRGDQGSSISSAIESLQEYGACAEELWPYARKRVNKQPDDRAYQDALQLVLDDAAQLQAELFAMKHCLAEGYPFVFGLTLFESFDRATRQGRVPMPDRRDRGRGEHGSHAMLAVGYSDKAESFVVRNSWGERWGDGGYCYIPYKYLANPKFCDDIWTIRALGDGRGEGELGWDDDGGFFDEEDERFDGQDSMYDDYELREYEEEDGGGIISSLWSFFFDVGPSEEGDDEWGDEEGALEEDEWEDEEDYDEDEDEEDWDEDDEDYDEEDDEDEDEWEDEDEDDEDSSW